MIEYNQIVNKKSRD